MLVIILNRQLCKMWVTAVIFSEIGFCMASCSCIYIYFIPIGIETTGVFGPEALPFFKELGRRLRARSGEPLSFCHLLQQIGVTIQRGNTAAVLGTAPGPRPGVEI